MGILDDVTAAVNRGAEAAQRTGKIAQLKMQIGDLEKQRRQLATQLGESLYDATKDNPELRAGRESIFDGIAQLDAQRAAFEQEIADIEAAALAAQKAAELAAQQAAETYVCITCGTTVKGTDNFCSGCGTSVATIKEAYAQQAAAVPAGPVCPSCGNAVVEGDLFCMSCGTKLQQPAPETPEPAMATAVVQDAVAAVPDTPASYTPEIAVAPASDQAGEVNSQKPEL